MFKILKSIKEGNKNITHETYDISKDLFFEISKMIKNEEFASNISFETFVSYDSASINSKGLKYLEENEDLYFNY